MINNSKTDIQIYLKCTNDSTGSDQPNLQDLASDMVPVVGSTESADAPVLCTDKGKYIFVGIWNDTTSMGKPDSWLIFDRGNKILNSSYDNYQATISGTRDSGYILNIMGTGVLPQNGNIWLIILIVVFVLFLIGIAGGAFFVLRKNGKQIETEMPFFVPQY